MSSNKKGVCWKCNHKIRLSRTEKLIKYGQTIKQCPNCGSIVVDERIEELGLRGIQKDDKRFISSGSWRMLLVGVALTAILTAIILFFFFSSEHRLSIPVFLFLGPVLLILGLFSLLKDMITYKKRKVALEEELFASKKRLEDNLYYERIKRARNPF